jgi:hypothetical protein
MAAEKRAVASLKLNVNIRRKGFNDLKWLKYIATTWLHFLHLYKYTFDFTLNSGLFMVMPHNLCANFIFFLSIMVPDRNSATHGSVEPGSLQSATIIYYGGGRPAPPVDGPDGLRPAGYNTSGGQMSAACPP